MLIFFLLSNVVCDVTYCFREDTNAKNCSETAEIVESLDDLKTKLSPENNYTVELGLLEQSSFSYDMNTRNTKSKYIFIGLNTNTNIKLTNTDVLDQLELQNLIITLENSQKINISDFTCVNSELKLKTKNPDLVCNTLRLTEDILPYFSSITVQNTLEFHSIHNTINQDFRIYTTKPISINFLNNYVPISYTVSSAEVVAKFNNGKMITIPYLSRGSARSSLTVVARAELVVDVDTTFQDFQQSTVILHAFKSLDLNIKQYAMIPYVIVLVYTNAMFNNLGFAPENLYVTNSIVKSSNGVINCSYLNIFNNGNLTLMETKLDIGNLYIEGNTYIISDSLVSIGSISSSKDKTINIFATLNVTGNFKVLGPLYVENWIGEGKMTIDYRSGEMVPPIIKKASKIKLALLSNSDANLRRKLALEMDNNITNKLSTTIPLIDCPKGTNIQFEGADGESLRGFSGSTTKIEYGENMFNFIYSESPLNFAPTFCIGGDITQTSCSDDPTRFFAVNDQDWKKKLTQNSGSASFQVKADTEINLDDIQSVSSVSFSVDSEVKLTITATKSSSVSDMSINNGRVTLDAKHFKNINSMSLSNMYLTIRNAYGFNVRQSFNIDSSDITPESTVIAFSSDYCRISKECKLENCNFENCKQLYVDIISAEYWSASPDEPVLIADSTLDLMKLDNGRFSIVRSGKEITYSHSGNKTVYIRYSNINDEHSANLTCSAHGNDFPTVNVYDVKNYRISGNWPNSTKPHVVDMTANPLTVYLESKQFPLGLSYNYNMKNLYVITDHDVYTSYEFSLQHYDWFPNILITEPYKFTIPDHICKFGGGLMGTNVEVIHSDIRANYEFEFNNVSFHDVLIHGNSSVYIYYQDIYPNQTMSFIVGWAEEPMMVKSHQSCNLGSVTVEVEQGARSPNVYHKIFCCDKMQASKKQITEKGPVKDLKIEDNCIMLKHNARSENALHPLVIAAIVFCCVCLVAVTIVLIWTIRSYRKVKARRAAKANKNTNKGKNKKVDNIREYRVDEIDPNKQTKDELLP